MTEAKNLLITILRNKNTSRAQFRYAAMQMAEILAIETTLNIQTDMIKIQTPITQTQGLKISKPITLIPILRSGLALLPAFLKMFPDALVGFVGMKRNEQTAEPMLYYKNIPTIQPNAQVIILDPMLATGGSAVATLKIITEMGIAQEQIIFVSIISAPEGVTKITHEFPKIKVIIAVQDYGLTPNKFITPGLGDFGDRFFGTE